ncbi:MAG: 5-(carboxyamino)imidazole ribonucleotide synthase [Ilumatobacteraceae bacterium]
MIVPPATLGILGGGQLGRYFVLAARTMGYRTMVLEPDPGAPAGAVADVHLVAAYDDAAALDRLAESCAVVTTEFENPPAAALARLAAAVPVHPSPHAIGIAQDRRSEKRFLAAAGIPVAPFTVIESPDDVALAERDHTFPAILKTARLGYDGKGQITVAAADDLADAWDALDRVPCVLEERVVLDGEVSVIVARSAAARSEPIAYPLCANVHHDGILDVTTVPGPYVPEAYELAGRIVTALGYVGVLAVELFVTPDGVLVNELAPRPHNSGHWTLDYSVTSQFEQQVRAVCGLPLGDPALTVEAAAMINVLGDAWTAGEPDWDAVLGHPSAPKLHLYGKAAARPGRKMGHVTVAAANPAVAAALARAVWPPCSR